MGICDQTYDGDAADPDDTRSAPEDTPWVQDPAEIVPCLVCGEPGPAARPCDCLAPTAFYTLVVEIKAKRPGDLPGRQELADAIRDGLPREWQDPDIDDFWLVSIYAEGAPETYNVPIDTVHIDPARSEVADAATPDNLWEPGTSSQLCPGGTP